jgi:hypothetical protein
LASILGPIVGGFLANPMKQYPKLANVLPSIIVKFFTKFPFTPPNTLLALMNLIAFTLGIFFLKESEKFLLQKKLANQSAEDEEMKNIAFTEPEIENNEELMEQEDTQVEQENEGDNQTLFKLADEEEPVVKHEPAIALSWKEFIRQKLKPENEIFRSYPPLTMAAVYASIGFVNIMYVEVLPLFLVLNAEDGGLFFGLRQIGILNAISSVFVFIWTLTASPYIIKKFGPTRTLKVSAVFAAPCVLFIPAVNYVYSIPALMWILIVGIHTYRVLFIHMMASTISILTNNSVTSANMGKLNGIAQSAVAATRAIGPVVAGSVYAWSLSINVFFKIYIIFFIMVLCYLGILLIIMPLPKSLDAPKILIPQKISDTESDESKQQENEESKQSS